jgi:hypothetical protein
VSSGYELGRAVEYAVIHELTRDGYHTVRAASSKGMADVVAVKNGQALFVSVKRTTPPGPKERAQLLAVAACLPGVGVPIVALGPASRVTYRRLTGHGPRDWVAWVPDEVAS